MRTIPVIEIPPERAALRRLVERANGYVLIGLIALIGIICFAGLVDALERAERRSEIAARV